MWIDTVLNKITDDIHFARNRKSFVSKTRQMVLETFQTRTQCFMKMDAKLTQIRKLQFLQ